MKNGHEWMFWVSNFEQCVEYEMEVAIDDTINNVTWESRQKRSVRNGDEKGG
jgi:hypothetical protein